MSDWTVAGRRNGRDDCCQIGPHGGHGVSDFTRRVAKDLMDNVRGREGMSEAGTKRRRGRRGVAVYASLRGQKEWAWWCDGGAGNRERRSGRREGGVAGCKGGKVMVSEKCRGEVRGRDCVTGKGSKEMWSGSNLKSGWTGADMHDGADECSRKIQHGGGLGSLRGD
eukprot:1055004-Rhodomonas_salina.1